MSWMLIAVAAWLVISGLLALWIGRAISTADKGLSDAPAPNFVVDLDRFPGSTHSPGRVDGSPSPSAADDGSSPRRPPPVPDRPTIPGLPVSRPSPPPPRRGPESAQEPPDARRASGDG